MSEPTVNFKFKRNQRKPSARTLIRTSDGDTPVIDQPVRMVSCDTPEKAAYAGAAGKSQPKLDTCRKRLETGFYDEVPKGLKDYLVKKLTSDAAQRHIAAGSRATEIFDNLLSTRLVKDDGSRRKVATIPTGEVVDRYGRLLAYLAPWYTGSKKDPVPPKDDPRRQTFNLDMVETGWASFFPIYPSLPENDDFNRAIRAASGAWGKKHGAWKEFGANLLLAYEFRMCIKLGTAKTKKAGMNAAFQRFCVDLRNLKVVGKFGFHNVPPCYRMWIWEEDLAQAKMDLGLSE